MRSRYCKARAGCRRGKRSFCVDTLRMSGSTTARIHSSRPEGPFLDNLPLVGGNNRQAGPGSGRSRPRKAGPKRYQRDQPERPDHERTPSHAKQSKTHAAVQRLGTCSDQREPIGALWKRVCRLSCIEAATTAQGRCLCDQHITTEGALQVGNAPTGTSAHFPTSPQNLFLRPCY